MTRKLNKCSNKKCEYMGNLKDNLIKIQYLFLKSFSFAGVGFISSRGSILSNRGTTP